MDRRALSEERARRKEGAWHIERGDWSLRLENGGEVGWSEAQRNTRRLSDVKGRQQEATVHSIAGPGHD